MSTLFGPNCGRVLPNVGKFTSNVSKQNFFYAIDGVRQAKLRARLIVVQAPVSRIAVRFEERLGEHAVNLFLVDPRQLQAVTHGEQMFMRMPQFCVVVPISFPQISRKPMAISAQA